MIWPVSSSCFMKTELTTDFTDVTDILFRRATMNLSILDFLP
jgi:hypothetical protein